MEVIRISSGIKILDESIQGGFPSGSVIVYLGEPGIGKTTSGLKFIQTGIQNSEKTLIITTSSTIPDITLLAEETDINLEETNFIDGANWRIRRVNPKSKQHSVYEVPNLTDLNALLATIIQACKDLQDVKRIFFDSPTSLLLYSTPGSEQVFRFFELLTAFTKSHKITLVYTLEEGVHTSSIVSTLLYMSDGSVYHRFEPINQKERQIKVSFLWLTNTYPTWITMNSFNQMQ
ncbi:MAG: RAD55 family ATPase [Candidatus Kariarchaeaceae archaeon]|jgi:circadian clock protein KaiC